MKYYMAPMEGLTGYIYRNAYQKYFHDIDRYFTPFITNKKLDFKVKKDIDPEHNQGMEVVPQILTNQPDDFISIVNQLKQYGYDEVNLNLGCPSGTVVAKNRGAGFLAVPDELDSFLDKIFNACDCKISIKTRVGKDSPDEWENLLAIYEKYPLSELIIHPRIQKDFYKYTPRMETYRYAAEHSRHSLCSMGIFIRSGHTGGYGRHFRKQKKSCLAEVFCRIRGWSENFGWWRLSLRLKIRVHWLETKSAM